MLYDVVIHDATKEIVDTLQPMLEEARIGYVIEPSQGAAKAYLESCKGWARYTCVENAVTALKDHPKNAKAVFGWNGSMANKFLRLAGVWDNLDQATKNVILGYEVAPGQDDPLPDPGDPGGGY